jgi:hypothetical protein
MHYALGTTEFVMKKVFSSLVTSYLYNHFLRECSGQSCTEDYIDVDFVTIFCFRLTVQLSAIRKKGNAMPRMKKEKKNKRRLASIEKRFL